MTDPSNTPGEKKRIQAVQTTMAIVDTLRERGSAGVTKIAEATGVTKGTVYNHLVTLEEEDYVRKGSDDKYQLGLRFIDVSHHVMSRVPVLDLASAEVDKLAEKSGEMALFTVEENGQGVCLNVSHGDQAVNTPVYVGHRDELHHTAVGKAILAHLPDDRVEEIIEERGLDRVTEHTITDREELLDELDTIRERGIAFNHQETIHGLVGVGAPIKDQDGNVLGALSIIGPASRMDEDRFQRELPDMIMRSVNIIEVNSSLL